mmetsp:Transcript_14350/g.21267  ORF Transcript_14350/g.21267 Transcript_14350/m.21267 type:complete len:215 (+) Transcript_14350:165-809(+)
MQACAFSELNLGSTTLRCLRFQSLLLSSYFSNFLAWLIITGLNFALFVSSLLSSIFLSLSSRYFLFGFLCLFALPEIDRLFDLNEANDETDLVSLMWEESANELILWWSISFWWKLFLSSPFFVSPLFCLLEQQSLAKLFASSSSCLLGERSSPTAASDKGERLSLPRTTLLPWTSFIRRNFLFFGSEPFDFLEALLTFPFSTQTGQCHRSSSV